MYNVKPRIPAAFLKALGSWLTTGGLSCRLLLGSQYVGVAASMWVSMHHFTYAWMEAFTAEILIRVLFRVCSGCMPSTASAARQALSPCPLCMLSVCLTMVSGHGACCLSV
jgi:hypothetical protein